jgi:hypothetical protein
MPRKNLPLTPLFQRGGSTGKPEEPVLLTFDRCIKVKDELLHMRSEAYRACPCEGRGMAKSVKLFMRHYTHQFIKIPAVFNQVWAVGEEAAADQKNYFPAVKP